LHQYNKIKLFRIFHLPCCQTKIKTTGIS